MTKNVSLAGLHPVLMRPRVEALIADPEFRAMGCRVSSAFRSDERQAELFADAVKRYGSAAKARKWVAPPGKSRHGPREPHTDGRKYGTAIDLDVPGVPPWHQGVKGQYPPALEAKVNALCARHGLASPMAWEDWHFEPVRSWSPTKPVVPAAKPRVEKPAPVAHAPVHPWPGHPTARGSKDKVTVEVIQRALGVTVDGDYGPKTAAAVRAFQKAHKVAQSGTVDRATWRVMFGA